MKLTRVLFAVVLLVVGATTVGCAPSGSDDLVGSGSSLEPDFKPGKRKHRAADDHAKGHKAHGAKPAAARAGKGTPQASPSSTKTPAPGSPSSAGPTTSPTPSPTEGPSKGPGGPTTTAASPTAASPTATSASPTATSASPTATPSAGGSTSVKDARGDVRAGLVGAPAYADVVGAAVTRTAGGFEVRVQVAAAFPQTMDGSNVENVVAFFDIDLDGQVDYETWGHLAEEGWSASGREPGGAKFGAASGITATPAGDTLVLTFPASVIGDPTSFQWSVATEYGSLAEVAAGTTSSDFAPDSGGVRFPA